METDQNDLVLVFTIGMVSAAQLSRQAVKWRWLVGRIINVDLTIMNKFDFLLGDWNLEYRIPKSFLSEAGSDSGVGSFNRALDDKYVIFDYSTKSGGEAKGVFAWDDKVKVYRYWWFENSGNFQTATCNFICDDILSMNWHDTLLVQTFVKDGPDKIVLKMQHPSVQGGYEIVLEVLFTRK